MKRRWGEGGGALELEKKGGGWGGERAIEIEREIEGGREWKLPVETACGLYTFGLYAKEGEFHSRLDCLIRVLILSPWQAFAIMMRKTSSQPSSSIRASQRVPRDASSQPSTVERADGEKVSSFPNLCYVGKIRYLFRRTKTVPVSKIR